MADFGTSVSGMEKLNEYNYRYWRTCMRTYLKSQGLWSIVDGDDATPPSKDKKGEYDKWEMKANKALLAIEMTIDKSLLSRIEDMETPKEAWDTLAALFSRENAARLQLLEKELMNVSQGTMSISDYFLKIKNLCREIEQLDAKSKFGDDRIRRIIIAGLKPEYNAFIAAIQGWKEQPSLVDLENLLANQEALTKQMTKTSIQDTEEALYTNSRGGHSQRRGSARRNERGGHQRRSIQRGELNNNVEEVETTKDQSNHKMTSVTTVVEEDTLRETVDQAGDQLMEIQQHITINMAIVKKSGILKPHSQLRRRLLLQEG